MQRSTRLVVPALLAMLALVVSGPVGALPGPDPADAPETFLIVVNGEHEGESEVFDAFTFHQADNWDFGDRESYRCAWVEYILDGVVQFTIEFERLEVPGHDGNYIVLIDRYGMETGDGPIPPNPNDVCGLPAGAGARHWDGEPFVAGGATLPVFKDGAPLITYTLPAVAAENDETFYSVGDEPGEAYQWYVEEGEANDAVVRISIHPQAPGVSLSPEPLPETNHDSLVTLTLGGHLDARGNVFASDGFAACFPSRIVRIERRVNGSWRLAGRDVTAPDGGFSVHLRDRTGVYRAKVVQASLDGGHVCEQDVSRKVRYERP